MLTRILAVALAAGSLAFVTAHAQTAPTTPQTTGLPGSGSADSDKTRPSTAPTTEPSQIHQPMSSGSSDKTSPSGGPTADTSGPSQAQQPMGSGRFDPSEYKTRIECLNAASAAYASFSLCSSLK